MTYNYSIYPTFMGWTWPPPLKKIRWNPNPQYLGTWPYLGTQSLQMQLIELRGGHTGVKWGPNPTPRVSLEKTSMGWQQAESRSHKPRIVRDRQEANDSPPGFKRNKALLTPSFWTSGPQNGETIHFCVVFFFLWCFKPPGLLNFLKATLGHEYKFQKQWWWTVTLSTRGQKLNDPRSAAFSEEVNSTSLYPQKLPGRSLPRVCPRTMQKGPRSDVALRVISHAARETTVRGPWQTWNQTVSNLFHRFVSPDLQLLESRLFSIISSLLSPVVIRLRRRWTETLSMERNDL